MTEEQVRRIVKDELQSLIKTDRFVFEKLIQIADGRNIQLSVGTGNKLGTAANQKLGLWGVTPVAQQADFGAMTDATGGSAGDQVSDVTASFNQANLNNSLASIAKSINDIRTVLRNIGIMA